MSSTNNEVFLFSIDKNRAKINSVLLLVFIFQGIFLLIFNTMVGNAISIWITTGIVLISVLFVNKGKLNIRFLKLISIVFTLFVFDYLLTINREGVLFYMFSFIKFSLPVLFLMSYEMDYKFLTRIWYYFSLFGSVLIILDLFVLNNFSQSTYMGYGYNMALILSGITAKLIHESSKLYFALLILGLIFTLFYGNSGSVLVVSLFISYVLYKKIGRKFIVFILLLFTVIAILYFSGLLLNLVDSVILYFQDGGLNSQTLRNLRKVRQLLLGDLGFSFSGRIEIYQNSLRLITSNNFLPLGSGYFINFYPELVYPHNLLLELFLVFGFFSIFIITFYIHSIVIFLKSNKDNYKFSFFIVFLILSLVRLSFSSSFIYSSWFWVATACLLFSKRKL